MLDVCLLGTGGMMPLPYRWLTSMFARYNGSNLLIDCGEGTQIAIKEKGFGYKQIDTICFTHFHADHISGLPGILLAMGNSERTKPLVIIGPHGLEKVVNALRVIAPELPFDIEFVEIEEKTQVIERNGYIITAFRVNHNVNCYGYSIEIKRNGKFQLDKAKEQNIPQKLWSKLQNGQTVEEEGVIFTPDMVLGPPRKGIKVTYTTDTRPTKSIVENAKESDLLICEGMYGEKGKEKKAVQYKHMTMYEAANIAKEACVKEMWLTHYSPSLTYPDEYIKDVKKIFDNTVAAKDGLTVEIDFID